MSKICCNFARFFESAVHSYIGITPDFGSEKRGSTPRWTTRRLRRQPLLTVKG